MANVSKVEEEQVSKVQEARKETERHIRQAAKKAGEIVEEKKPAVQAFLQGVEKHSPPVFIGLTIGSILGSITLWSRKSRESAIFVGLWAPTFLTLGLFYTLVGAGKTRK